MKKFSDLWSRPYASRMSVWHRGKWTLSSVRAAPDKEMKAAQTTCGLEGLLEIERRTMKNH